MNKYSHYSKKTMSCELLVLSFLCQICDQHQIYVVPLNKPITINDKKNSTLKFNFFYNGNTSISNFQLKIDICQITPYNILFSVSKNWVGIGIGSIYTLLMAFIKHFHWRRNVRKSCKNGNISNVAFNLKNSDLPYIWSRPHSWFIWYHLEATVWTSSASLSVC